MTGAGSAQVAYALEDSYGEPPAEPTWIQPFVDLEIGSITLDNALTRSRQPDDPRPVESREGPIEGSIDVSGTMANTDFHDLVFADGGTNLASSASLAPTATWYFAADLLPGSADRFPAGAYVTSATWNYTEGEDITVDLSIEFRAGEKDLSAPSSIQQAAVADAIPWHGASFQISGTEVEKLSSLTLEIANLARHRPQQSREAADAVVGAYEPSISFEAIPGDETNQELAYGSTSSASTQETIDSTALTFALENSSGSVATYDISTAQTSSYDWSNHVGDDDLMEVVNDHVADVAVA